MRNIVRKKMINFFHKCYLFLIVWCAVGFQQSIAQTKTSSSVPNSIRQEEAERLRSRATALVKDYYSKISLITGLPEEEKEKIMDDVILNFENRNVQVVNDIDPTKRTESDFKVSTYLESLDLFFSSSNVEIGLGRLNISQLFRAEEFIFLKADVVRGMTISKNTGQSRTDSIRLDIYIKFLSGRNPKIYSILEHRDNLQEFKPLPISNTAKSIEAVEGSVAPLKIISQPSSAIILLNDQETNLLTPEAIELPKGLSKISLRASNHLPFDTLLDIKNYNEVVINKKLTPNWAEIEVTTKPERAEIIINGRKEGTGQVLRTGSVMGLKPGFYIVEARVENFRPAIKELNLKAGDKVTIELAPEAITGKLFVETAPPGADVAIDGNLIGKTPLSKEFSVGSYQVTISLQDHQTHTETISIYESKDTSIKKDLVNFYDYSRSLRSTRSIVYILGITGLAAGGYLMYSAETSYKAYATATTNAASLREKVEFGDKISPISLAVGGVAMVTGFAISRKISKLKKSWNISAGPYQNGAVVAFSHKF